MIIDQFPKSVILQNATQYFYRQQLRQYSRPKSLFSEIINAIFLQPEQSAIIQAWHMISHTAWMPDKTDAKNILTAAHLENWRRPPGRPHTT